MQHKRAESINYLTWERQQRIIELLETQGVVQVAELAKLFGVSELTVRRDLNQLVQRRNVERVHGGAVLAVPDRTVQPSSITDDPSSIEFEKMAEAAYHLIQPGQTILIGAGAATNALARLLTQQQGITVVTTSLEIASLLVGASEIKLVVTGGLYDSRNRSLIGHFSKQTIGQLHVDFCFVTALAFDTTAGVTSDEAHEVDIYRAMISAAQQTYLLAEQNRIGKKFIYSVAPCESIHGVITSSEVPTATSEVMQDLGIKLFCV